MNKKELQRFEELIEAEKQRVRERLGMIDSEIRGLKASESGKPAYSNHMADIGSESMETEQAFLHARQGTDHLSALEAAQTRIEKGNYGTCEECGETIPSRRLEAYLAARLCVGCKSHFEKTKRG